MKVPQFDTSIQPGYRDNTVLRIDRDREDSARIETIALMRFAQLDCLLRAGGCSGSDKFDGVQLVAVVAVYPGQRVSCRGKHRIQEVAIIRVQQVSMAGRKLVDGDSCLIKSQ